MDPQTDLPDLVEDLEVNIDELTTTLAPLLSTQLSTTASSLPLLDKAKLYVLAAYSIESLLYSTLQASGVNAKEHQIFKELARLKGYFGKIKHVEERPVVPKSKLDVSAAARFIKHGLAGNEKYDLERAERMAKERARAQLKARQINKKFDEEGREYIAPKKRGVDEVVAEEDDGEMLTGLEDAPSKKPKLAEEGDMEVDGDSAASQPRPRKSKRGKKKSKSTETSDADIESQEPSQEAAEAQDDEAEPASTRPKRKQRGKKNKASADEAEQETATPTRTTRSKKAGANTGGEEAEAPKKRGRPRKSK
ncbi:hypothetical protein HBI17_007220 [Parastagonospora nodorum]|nr:hypothetical protein HBH43_237060 [Parastagonospora nodorum]KAH4614577.1 hypothetical protein HBH82_005490 [Parastagonospora nodorum]KAH4668005.1 hypothetical protein HBH78_193900 [Parastagonospora nodorum]KAH4698444.1 hypothetical protein HBH67_171790 [Parastagonospora nodorum]KAH4794009.1 hypothetical protein HBH62_006580 [Parastagonospora nodorum]